MLVFFTACENDLTKVEKISSLEVSLPIETSKEVEIIYSEFKNAASQVFIAESFLPVQRITPIEGNTKKSDFIFEPNQQVLITELMPKILNTQLFKAVLDANASEHGARMTAMDKASDNANELLKSLKISYNRARQAAITTELTEIVSGAAALQG
jgi:F-type H+-transporting ATPase subunit gamma